MLRRTRLLAAALLVPGAALLAAPATTSTALPPPEQHGAHLHHSLLTDEEFEALQPTSPPPSALVDPTEPEPNCTYLPRKTPSYDDLGNVQEVHPIYFLPQDTATMNYDLIQLCDNGGKRESSIGYALHNIRKWMSTPGTGAQYTSNHVAMSGKAFKVPLRTDTAYGYTTKSYNVTTIRGWSPASFYEQPGRLSGGSEVVFSRIRTELELRGFNHPNVKYLVFADVRNPNYYVEEKGGTLGTAEYNGNLAIVYQRYTKKDGSTARAQWGCATEGDSTAAHELVHLWGSTTGFRHDLSNPADLMHDRGTNTFRGLKANGANAKISVWDADPQDDYTNRVLSFPGYLNAGPSSDLHFCPPMPS